MISSVEGGAGGHAHTVLLRSRCTLVPAMSKQDRSATIAISPRMLRISKKAGNPLFAYIFCLL